MANMRPFKVGKAMLSKRPSTANMLPKPKQFFSTAQGMYKIKGGRKKW